jgi:hypothetical protein
MPILCNIDIDIDIVPYTNRVLSASYSIYLSLSLFYKTIIARDCRAKTESGTLQVKVRRDLLHCARNLPPSSFNLLQPSTSSSSLPIRTSFFAKNFIKDFLPDGLNRSTSTPRSGCSAPRGVSAITSTHYCQVNAVSQVGPPLLLAFTKAFILE